MVAKLSLWAFVLSVAGLGACGPLVLPEDASTFADDAAFADGTADDASGPIDAGLASDDATTTVEAGREPARDTGARQDAEPVAMDAAERSPDAEPTVDASVPPQVYQLHVTIDGNGRLTSSPAGITCGTDCDQGWLGGTTIELDAIPDPGWAIVAWTGCTPDASTPTRCTLDLASDLTVSATFYPTLIVTTLDARAGETAAPRTAGTACGAGCTAFPVGTNVSMTTTGSPRRGVEWSGCDQTIGSTCSVMITGPRALTAQFINVFTLTLTVQGPGSGSIHLFPPSRDLFLTNPIGATLSSNEYCPYYACNLPGGCPPRPALPVTCSFTYAEGTTVGLSPTATSPSTFGSWMGDCAGAPLRTCDMIAARNVTAVFSQ